MALGVGRRRSGVVLRIRQHRLDVRQQLFHARDARRRRLAWRVATLISGRTAIALLLGRELVQRAKVDRAEDVLGRFVRRGGVAV